MSAPDIGSSGAGTAFEVSHGPVTSELFVRLATLLNDFNPAHYDLEFATSVGMPGVIAPGTLLQGWLLADIEAHLEHPTPATGRPHRVREIDLRLRSSFGAGDVVTITYETAGDGVQAVAKLGAGSRGTVGATVATANISLSATEAQS